jgi:ABC-2 type transport system permease protein
VSDIAILRTQTRYALLVASRNSRVIVFGIVFPIVLLVMFNSIFTSGKNATVRFSAGRLDSAAYFTAGLAAYAIMLQTFSSLVIAVTTERETGQLKRLRGTPMPAWTFVTAYVLRSVVLVVVMVTALFVIGALAFGVDVRAGSIVGLVVYVLLGTFAMATLGMAVTAFTPTADAAASVGPFTAVILSFVSGVFIPDEILPNWQETFGRVFPLAPLADGLQRALAASGGSGTGLTAGNIGSLVGWGVVGLVVAARTFRWEPLGAAA